LFQYQTLKTFFTSSIFTRHIKKQALSCLLEVRLSITEIKSSSRIFKHVGRSVMIFVFCWFFGVIPSRTNCVLKKKCYVLNSCIKFIITNCHKLFKTVVSKLNKFTRIIPDELKNATIFYHELAN